MSTLAYLHQFFNIGQCQSYLHTLRWKDRPLQCPRCQSLNVGPWGTYHAQPGLQRYRCKERGCKRTFNDTTWRVIASRSAIEEHLSYRRTTSVQEQRPCCRLLGSQRASAKAWRNTVTSFVGRQGSTMSVAMSPA